MILDLALLGIFILLIGFFLYKNRSKIKKEGWLLLYHTSWGTKLIEKTGKKYKKLLSILSYVSVYLGYALMAVMIWLFAKLVWLYTFNSSLIKSVKMPPIMPLVPYLPQMFKLSFLPPFYFSYWIIILAIIAITHEFFHGIFASSNNIKTKTTGFGFFPFFLPVFLAAFVNLDEKIMQKKSNFAQRAVLSAGTFANLLTAILGVVLMWLFFISSFSASGVIYTDYAYNPVKVSDITSINGINITQSQLEQIQINTSSNAPLSIKANGQNYIALKKYYPDLGVALLYYDSPAFREKINGAILKINDQKIDSLDTLSFELEKYRPGEKVNITLYNEEEKNIEITLSSSPENETKAWIGVMFSQNTPSGIVNKIVSFTSSYKDSNVYYSPNYPAAKFIYDFLWWLVLISFSVALINMLPMGIFDGGRFFYLTILKLTRSQKAAEKSFTILTQVFLAALLLIMVFWAKNLF